LEKLGNQNRKQAGMLGALLLVIACAVFFAQLGSYPLFNPDEALYAEPAREMLQTHNYITTTLNYQTRFTKPPLCIWMEALSYKALGISEFSARLFSAVCAVALVMTVFIFLLSYVEVKAAFLGALSLLSAPMFVSIGRMSITDMPLSLFISGSLFSFFTVAAEYLPARTHLALIHRQGLLYMSYVLMGLAVMTKGPVGVVLPVVIIFVYHFVHRNLKDALKFYQPARGAAIVSVIALPWFAAEIITTHGGYFKAFLLRENFQRFTQIVDSHHGAWWYHLAAICLGFFPWIVFVPQAMVRAFQGTGNKLPGKLLSKSPNKPPNKPPGKLQNMPDDEYGAQGIRRVLKNELLLFSTLSVCCVVIFFSLSASKLLPYTLPAFPALACLLALELDYIFELQAWRRIAAPVAVLVIAFSAVGLLTPTIFSKLRHVPQPLFADVNAFLAFQTFLTIAVLILLLFLYRAKAAAVSFLFLAQVAAFAYFGGDVLFKLSNLWEAPIPVLSRMAAALGEPIFVYKMRKVSVPFYARRATVLSPNQEFLTTTVEQELPKYPRACIIASMFDLKHFAGDPHFRLIKQLGNYVLVEWTRG
jgi:4-amino-4-deoxy-L-arabinose transferase-like glycosyltransferase